MKEHADTRNAASAPDLVAAATRLRPLVARHAADAAAARRLSPVVVAAMRDSGIFLGAVARELGGLEASPIVQLKTTEALAYADCSAAWCAMVGFTSGGLSSGFATERAVGDVAENGRWPIFAGTFAAAGDAETVDGGYVVTGRWGFVSGIHHSQWLIAAARVTSGGAPLVGGDGRPATIFVLIPARSLTIEDTWHAAGLEGTGSTHVNVSGLFVPAHMTTPFNAPRQRGGGLYRAPLAAILGPGIAGCYLGAARRALDEIVALAPGKTRFRRSQAIGERGAFQRDLGALSTAFRAARLALLDTLSDIWEDIAAGEDVPVEKFAAFQAANTYGFHTASDVAAFAYQYAGIEALFTDNILQKIQRDLMAMGQHVALANENYEFGGKALLGAAEHSYNTAPRPRR